MSYSEILGLWRVKLSSLAPVEQVPFKNDLSLQAHNLQFFKSSNSTS